MSELPAAPAPGDEEDPEGTRILTVADVLGALDSLQGEVGPHAAAVAEMLARKEAASAARHEARQELLRQLAEEPHKFGFFQAVRLLENAHPGLPRIGTSLRTETRPSSCLCKGDSSSRPYSDSSSRSDAAPPLPSLSISDR